MFITRIVFSETRRSRTKGVIRGIGEVLCTIEVAWFIENRGGDILCVLFKIRETASLAEGKLLL